MAAGNPLMSRRALHGKIQQGSSAASNKHLACYT